MIFALMAPGTREYAQEMVVVPAKLLVVRTFVGWLVG